MKLVTFFCDISNASNKSHETSVRPLYFFESGSSDMKNDGTKFFALSRSRTDLFHSRIFIQQKLDQKIANQVDRQTKSNVQGVSDK